MKKLLIILPVLGFALMSFNYAQAQTEGPEPLENNEEQVETTADSEVEEDVAIEESDDAEIVNSDQTEPFETGIVDDSETELINDEVEIDETTIDGEVVELTDEYLVIETESGEQVKISRGGGSLLSPFVRQATLANVQVGDEIEVTVAESATLEGEVQGVTEGGALVVVTKDGQRRTIQPGLNGVSVLVNGKKVTDFTTLSAGDEVEVVYEGELISQVDSDSDPAGGWITPVVIILIVLGLAAVLARRGNKLD